MLGINPTVTASHFQAGLIAIQEAARYLQDHDWLVMWTQLSSLLYLFIIS